MDNTLIITIALIAFPAYIAASFFYPMLAGGAGYTATPKDIAAEALRLVGLKRDEVFFDLGCGTGETLIAASKLCDHVYGVEIEPVRWFIAKLRARRANVVLGNLFKQNISEADVVFVFQYKGKINSRVVERVKADTQPGTRIVSYYWPIENMKLLKRQRDIFVYVT